MAEQSTNGSGDSTYHIDQFLEMMVEHGASDLIVKADCAPSFRINGEIQKVDMDGFKPEQTEKLAADVMSEDKLEDLLDGEEYDGSYLLKEGIRFRVNAFLQRETVAIVFRHIENEIFSFSELNLPASVEKLANYERGLILVTGTTSSGKSTTLASIVDYINSRMRKHVITVEDPIEYLHEDKKGIVSQREIGLDTKDYSSALKYILRQDPDVILLGEMRDKETVQAALEAAETGHLVYSTLHTHSATHTIDRILDFFTGQEQQQIRSQVSQYLKGICAQRLLPRADGGGMVPAVEIMFNTPMIQKLIMEERLDSLRSAIHQGESQGMQTFDQAVVELFNNDWISEEEAKRNCSNPDNFEMYKQGKFPDIQTGVLGGGVS